MNDTVAGVEDWPPREATASAVWRVGSGTTPLVQVQLPVEGSLLSAGWGVPSTVSVTVTSAPGVEVPAMATVGIGMTWS